MKKFFSKKMKNRLLALMLAAVTVFSGLPTYEAQAETSQNPAPGTIETVADTPTIQRVETIYGDNTQYAGKITVGKSVSDTGYEGGTLDGVNMSGVVPGANNFLVTLGQTAQVMGLAKEMTIPIDAVFVLDTSNSMSGNRYVNMINAANNAISTLMAANEHNRIAVVAFSSEDDGGGTSDGAAASVLSDLAHYDGEAATTHLQRVNNIGTVTANGGYVAGRNPDTYTYRPNNYGPGGSNQVTVNVNSFRDAVGGGTNIHAGIALGASLLMDESKSTTAVIEGKTVTRIPFVIVLSDGAPTYSYNATNWYDADDVLASTQRGPGNGSYAGNGFLPAMTAAYYKGAITDRYFGANANEDSHCQIYTIGVGVGSDEFAQMTLNPKAELGNSNNDYYRTFHSYWSSYQTGSNFNIRTNDNTNYQMTAASINATKNFVNGKRADGTQMYTGGLAYNDAYFASDDSDLARTFDELVRLIQIKAISLPTDVTYSTDFGGYVHFYDPIGEYMEVKKMHGIVAKGTDPEQSLFYQGKSFVRHLRAYNDPTSPDYDATFNEAFEQALAGRLTLSNGDATNLDIAGLVEKAVASGNQLVYENDGATFNNSFCWWGNEVISNTLGDDKMQYLGWAADDSVDYLTSAAGAAAKPANATHVNRSYYYYGTASDTIAPTQDALLFAIRVQRSLTAPYQQTVYVSIPGSLLSVNRVLVTEKENGTEAEVFVQNENPVRVIYEVGLQDDINAFNVEEKLAGSDYVNERTAVTTLGSKHNYEEDIDTYYFYTNDWDRSGSQEGHSRAMTRAGFDISEDNEFYTYTEDRELYSKNGNTYTLVTAVEVGETYYYAREYYDWSEETGATQDQSNPNLYNGSISNMKKIEYVPVSFGSTESINAVVKEEGGKYYIKKGTHTSASLASEREVASKGSGNNTNTSADVAHYMKTDAVHESSHYTVYLGNNGRLALTAQKSKDVTISRPNEGSDPTIINNADGQTVTVGDELTYTITVKNTTDAVATVVATDAVPAGTKYVSHTDATGTVASTSQATDENADSAVDLVTWTFADMAAGASTTVTMTVKVTEDVLDAAVVSVENKATVQIGNTVLYTTNIVDNPPTGKKVEATDPNVNLAEGIKVGDELRYTIEWANTSGQDNATVKIVDNVPAGTQVIENLIYPAAGPNVEIELTNNNQTITWTLKNVQKDATGTVNFVVVVTEDAETPVENEAIVTIGENSFTTNSTDTSVLTGNLAITKSLDNAYYVPTVNTEVYQLKLRTRAATVADVVKMGRTFDIQSSIAANNTKYADYQIEFVEGVATQLVPKAGTTGLSNLDLTIAPGETLTIIGVPAGAEIMAEETAVIRGSESETLTQAGYTASGTGTYATVVASGTATANIAITNTYEPADSVYRIMGVKQLTTTGGAVIGATPFDMGVWKADANGIIDGSVLATTIATVDSTATGSKKAFTFKDNTVTAAEVLAAANKTLEQYFVVKELQSDMIGVTYDTTEYLVKVTTVDNNKGELVSSYEYKTRADASAAWGTTWSASTVVPDSGNIALVKDGAAADETFVNNFAPLEFTLNDHLTATKTLTGRAIEAGEFRYVVVDAATKREIATGTAGTAAAGTAAQITFTTMKFQAAGVYTLEVYEVDSGRAGVTYDTAVFTVKVNVVQDGSQLKLADTNGITYSATRAGNNSATGATVANVTGIEFNNTYGTFTLDGTKTVRNSDGSAAHILDAEYDFVIYDAAGNPVGGGSHGPATPASGDATATITFDTIGYSVTAEELARATANNAIVKTLTYTIKEIKPTAGLNLNMDYDETVWTVEVPVRYNWNTGVVSVDENEISYTPAGGSANTTGAAFINTQYPSSVAVKPTAQKATEGNVVAGVTFSFAVRTADGTTVSVGTVAADATAQLIDFHEIEYTRPGTYNYWLLETNTKTADSGVAYDSDKYRMEVVITRGEDGNPEGMLAVKSVKYYGYDGSGNIDDIGNYNSLLATDILFENTYSATGHINITAKKSLTATNSTGMAANQFAFRLERLIKEADGTFTNTGRYINGVNQAAAAGAEATVSFATINFSDDMFAEGENEAYIYARMSEIDLGVVGYDYDDTTYRLEIKLTREGVGKAIVSEVTSVTKETWSNGSITATEALSGVVTAGTDSAAINVTFKNSYTPVQAGYVDIVAEKNLTGRNLIDAEFTFDLYHITDGDTDNVVIGGNAVFLDSESVIKTDDATGTVTFRRHYPVTVNTGTYVYMIKERNEGKTGIVYDEKPVFAYVSVRDEGGVITATLHDSKTDADAATNGKAVIADTFNNMFVTYSPVATKNLTGRDLIANGFSFEVRQMTRNAADDYTVGSIVSTGTNKADGTVEFAPLYFSQANTDYYYEISEIRGTNGAIKYDTTKYYLKVNVAANGVVTPTYYASDDFDTAPTIAANTVVFNNAYEANGTIQLKAIKELIGRPASMKEAEFTFEIRTTPDRTGTLVAGGESKADADNDGMTDIVFGLLSYTQSNFDKPVNGEAVSGDDTTGWTHTYYLLEIPKDTAATGITYSNAVYKVDVTVKDDGFGVLSTSAVYTRYSGSAGAGDLTNGVPTFTNTYTAQAATFTLEANKSLLGKALKEAFNFNVTRLGETTPVATGVNAAPSGIVTFDADSSTAGNQNMSVTTAGTHDFIIEESEILPTPIVGDGKDAGTFTRDAAKYLARVNVIDNNSGKLQVSSITYYKWNTDLATTLTGTPVTSAGFINSYTPATLTVDLDAEINAQKTVTGEPYSMPANVFQFEVKDSRGTTVATGTNKAGTEVGGVMTAGINFTEFTFDSAAEYRYIITETNTGEAHFTYDTRQWEARINVVYDNDKGYLKVDSVNTYEIIGNTTSTTEADPAFVNEYNPAPVDITIQAKKIWITDSLRTLKAHEFTFRVLEDVNGQLIIRAEAQNDADGNVEFNFTETKAGTHTYVIREVIPTTKETGVTYDYGYDYGSLGEREIVVQVGNDESNGRLYVDVNGNHQYDAGEEDASYDDSSHPTQTNFTNIYNGLPTTASITVNKVLHGAVLTDDAFTFELLDETGAPVIGTGGDPITAKNKADGTITFANLPFNAAGRYTYQIKEVAGSLAYTTYDASTIEVIVEVDDNLAGHLVATVIYPTDITFENTYKRPTPPPDELYAIFNFSKVWLDGDNVLGKRPDAVYLEVYKDGVYERDVVLTKDNDWFNSVILIKSKGKHEYQWTIKEKNVPEGYTATYDQTTRTVTNTYTGLLKEEAPKTGDNSLVELFFGLSSASIAALFALIFAKKRRKQN